MIQPTHLKYRSDIDGLRAVAVLLVVGFHAFPNRIMGGFVGVDIFFVISGYLISSIIFSNLASNSFSLLDFYKRRILRIYPALIVMIIACAAMGWAVLFSQDYAQLGKHVAGGAGFVSNLVLWSETGYFDGDANSKPLLHLWSLAIEEQFYIFWPLLLMLAWSKKLSVLKLTTIIGLASFLVGIYLVNKNPTAAFYFPGSRFWELMVGGLLAYINLYKTELNADYKNLQSLAGFTLLGVAVLIIRPSSPFPGWWALLPTFGAFFIISAGPTAFFNRIFLSNKWMVNIGLISYPLYLWHWPVFTFTYLTVGQVSGIYKVTLVVLSFFLAYLTYKLVEQPLRTWKFKKELAISLFVGMAATGVMGFFLYVSGGLEGHGIRTPEKSEYLAYFENSKPDWKYFKKINRAEKYRYDCDFFDLEQGRIGNRVFEPRPQIDISCFTRKSKQSKVILIWGDSHAQHLYWGLKQGLPKNWEILQVASSGCNPNVESSGASYKKFCDYSNQFALHTIEMTKPDIVMIAQNLDHNLVIMNKISDKLKSDNVKKVLFLGPTPHWNQYLPKIIAGKLWESTPRRTNIGLTQKVIFDNAKLKKAFIDDEHQKFINLIDFFCNQQGCLTYIGNDKKIGLTSYDYGHLTPIASEYLAKELLVPIILAN